jgi:hypothetical protein
MNFLITYLLHYLSQLSLVVVPVYLAYWLNHRK